MIDKPMVSVGLPVYNGELYLSDAIDSVLGQTFDDLELIISDNASTDRTEEICHDFAARDKRVRYSRNSSNLGAAPNYNLTFEPARGRYFMWLAHDDILCEEFIEQMVGKLGSNPNAVICNSLVEYIDSKGHTIGIYNSGIAQENNTTPSGRFATVILQSHSCVDFFGLIRRRAMQNSLLHGSFHGADRAFLAQMALRGTILQVPNPLKRMREHEARYTRTRLSPKERLRWHDSSASGRFHMPALRLYREYLGILRSQKLPRKERLNCYGVLIQWWFTNWNAFRLLVDLLALVNPKAVSWAENTKIKLFGKAPGHFHK